MYSTISSAFSILRFEVKCSWTYENESPKTAINALSAATSRTVTAMAKVMAASTRIVSQNCQSSVTSYAVPICAHFAMSQSAICAHYTHYTVPIFRLINCHHTLGDSLYYLKFTFTVMQFTYQRTIPSLCMSPRKEKDIKVTLLYEGGVKINQSIQIFLKA